VPNRRDFILQTTYASTALASSLHSAGYAARPPKPVRKPLRILVLGATGHIGPHFVQAALARGHSVSAFVRAADSHVLAQPTQASLPPSVERLVGDRNGDLRSLMKREWDGVFDLATYGPIWVKTLGEALRDRVRHYTFISSADVYTASIVKHAGDPDETSTVVEYTGTSDSYSPALTTPDSDPSFQYGPLKVLCEREAEKQFPGKALIVRPSYIVGPNDSVGAFVYLPARMEKGGEILAAGDPLCQVDIIDVRDMAEWVVRMTESGTVGVFNASGPAMPLGWAELLGAIRGQFSTPLTLRWVPTAWLHEQGVTSVWNYFLFWSGESDFGHLTNSKAIAHGLTFRPLDVTIGDTLAWYKRQPEKHRKFMLGSVEGSLVQEAELLRTWHATKGVNQGNAGSS
jgi:2'-hydroxyisoflavone reductase